MKNFKKEMSKYKKEFRVASPKSTPQLWAG